MVHEVHDGGGSVGDDTTTNSFSHTYSGVSSRWGNHKAHVACVCGQHLFDKSPMA